MEQVHLLERATVRRDRLAKVVLIASLTVVLVAGALIAWVLWKNGWSDQDMAWTVAGLFVAAAVPISGYDIRNHLLNFEIPELQKFMVRILFMVPIYSVTCWLCLGNEDFYVILETLRSLYEAFVIWSFTYFLMGYLGPTEEMLATRLEGQIQQEQIFPVNYILKPWKMGREFLQMCKLGTLQYVVWMIVNTWIVLLSSLLGLYGDGEWRPDRAYIYVIGITNLSQMVAIYALVIFYQATHHDLAPINPLAKFLCIKAVVFFSFWQGCLISALVYFGVIENTPFFDAELYAKGLQDFCICIEMLFFAVAHHYIFSYKDFCSYSAEPGVFSRMDSNSSSGSSASNRSHLLQALIEAANPRDLVHDITQNFRLMQNRNRTSAQTASQPPGRLSSSEWGEPNREYGSLAAVSHFDADISIDADQGAYSSGSPNAETTIY